MLGGLASIARIPELKKRILFTLGMLAVYRFGVFVSVPGVNVAAIKNAFETHAGSLFGLINMFSGGALENFSIFSLGIAPYISVSIIMQMLTPTVPSLERLKKEGEAGQRIITRYTRYFTIGLALIQGYFISVGLEKSGYVTDPGLLFRITTMSTLTAGTAFIMWLGEQVTERGLGNGISIIIFAGIVARMPSVLGETVALVRVGEIAPLSIIFLLIFCVMTIAGIVFVERSFRKVPIQYPRRVVGKNNMTQAQTQYMPLKLNMAGVYPPIFASAILVVPATIASFSGIQWLQDIVSALSPGTLIHDLVFIGLILSFSFFFTAVIFNPVEMAENLKKNGGFIPTVRPGKETADFLYAILNRLTLWGAIYISLVCIVPHYVYAGFGALSFAAVFGGTAVLIAVGVTLDTASQVESYVVSRNYEAFMAKGAKIRGGAGSMGYMRTRALKR